MENDTSVKAYEKFTLASMTMPQRLRTAQQADNFGPQNARAMFNAKIYENQ